MSNQVAVSLAILAAHTMVSRVALAEVPPGPEPSHQIQGQVLDSDGQPIEGARVTLRPRDPEETPAAAVETWSGPDGSFDFRAPLPPERCEVLVMRDGYKPGEAKALSAGSGKVTVTIVGNETPGGLRSLSGETRDERTGQPVPGADVVLIGERHLRMERKADANGRFEFPGLPGAIGQGIIIARDADRVSHLQMARGPATDLVLALGPGAKLAGIVSDHQSGAAVPDCTVTLRPLYVSRFRLRTRTQKDGQFEFADVPPGDYTVEVIDDEIYGFLSGYKTMTRFPLVRGRTSFFPVPVRKKATVGGQILSPDGSPVRHAKIEVRGRWPAPLQESRADE